MENGNNQNETIETLEIQTEENKPRDLETFFKEHRNNQEEYEVRKLGGVIVFLALIALALGGYIFFDKFLRIEEPVSNNGGSTTTDNGFNYTNYSLNLPKEIDSPSDIYAIDIKAKNSNTYELYGRYTSEKSIKVATIIGKENSDLEHRSIDVEDNKLYFMITSKENGTIFELQYIDLTDLASGAKSVAGFDEIFKTDNLWKVSGKDAYYSSQIYVKENDIFYTSYVSKSLRKYNMGTKESETIIEDVEWNNYFIDKKNNQIYYSNEDKVYSANMEGKNAYELSAAKYNKGFWLKAYYNNMPAFGFPNGGSEAIDIYVYRETRKEFIRVEENVGKYNMQYNNINATLIKDETVLETIFIA